MPPTTLFQKRAERIVLHKVLEVWSGQEFTGLPDRLKFQVSAADCADNCVIAHEHLGASFERVLTGQTAAIEAGVWVQGFASRKR